jgi:hypothetical protein
MLNETGGQDTLPGPPGLRQVKVGSMRYFVCTLEPGSAAAEWLAGLAGEPDEDGCCLIESFFIRRVQFAELSG